MEATYHTDFKFGNKYLSDFGGVIKNNDGWEIKHGVTTTKATLPIPNKGELLFGYSYNARIIPVSIYIDEDIDIDEFYGWLLNGEQTFSYVDDGREIQAILDNEIDIKAYFDNNFKCTLDLSFIAYDPYWRITNEKKILKTSIVLNTPISFKSKGNVESYPLIRIKPNGTQSKIRFKWNGQIIALTNITKDFYIDSEQEECYEMNLGSKVIASSKFYSTEYYDYPIFKVGKNTFELIEGSILELEILPNTRFI